MTNSLEHQMLQLIMNAPQDGKMPQAMAAIAPILLEVAQQFGQTEYYILQSLQQNWQITTLQNRTEPDLTKTVIYAYAELKDATEAGRDPNLIAQAIPAVDLLFQFISLPDITSLILLERQSGETQSLEIHQSALKQLIQKQLEMKLNTPIDHVDQDSDPQDSGQDESIHLA